MSTRSGFRDMSGLYQPAGKALLVGERAGLS